MSDDKQVFRAHGAAALPDEDGKKVFRSDTNPPAILKPQKFRASEKVQLLTKKEKTPNNPASKILMSKFVMKLVHNRAAQFISAGAGLLVGKLVTAGFLETIQENAALSEFLMNLGISPTEAGIMGFVSGLFWAVYNLLMTLAYGAKFRQIQVVNDLEPDRWAGPKTMAAITPKK